DLYLYEDKIAHIMPATPSFIFLKYLYDNFDTYKSREDIFEHCKKQIESIKEMPRYASEYTAKTFCESMRREIIGHATGEEFKDIIKKIIEYGRTTQDQAAYRLTSY